jgi:hypothetical protein
LGSNKFLLPRDSGTLTSLLQTLIYIFRRYHEVVSNINRTATNFLDNYILLQLTRTIHPKLAMTSKLLSIPPELRQKIYVYALTSPNGYFSIPFVRTGSRDNLALLLTCGQVYDEAKNICFQQNSWEVTGEKDMFAFQFIPLRDTLNKRLGNNVQHICFYREPLYNFGFQKLDAACRLLSEWVRNGKLRTISITLLPWSVTPADGARGLVPGVFRQRILGTLISFLTQGGLMQEVERTLNLHPEYSQHIIDYEPHRTDGIYIQSEMEDS